MGSMYRAMRVTLGPGTLVGKSRLIDCRLADAAALCQYRRNARYNIPPKVEAAIKMVVWCAASTWSVAVGERSYS